MIGRCSVQGKLGTPPSTPLMNRKSGSSEKYNRLIPPRRPGIVEASKRHAEYNELESKKYIEEKRRKVKFIDSVPMASEKVKTHQEPVFKKRKRVTGIGHGFKSRYKPRAKEIVPEKSPVSQSKKLPSYEETEEQVQSRNPKKQCLKLKVIHPRDPRNTTIINQETSIVDGERLDHSPLILRLVNKNIEKASAKEGGYENQILSKKKQVSKDNDRKDSSRAECCAKEILSPKERAVKEIGAGNEIKKDSARAEVYKSQILSRKKEALKDKGAGNKIGKDSARAEHCENQTLSMKKQAVKDKGAGNEREKCSAREEHCEKHISQKKQAKKDKGAGNEIEKDSSRERHCENQILSKNIQAVKDIRAGNEIGKDSSREEYLENRINSKEKQAVKDKGAGKELNNDSSREEHCENQILYQKKQAKNDMGAGKEMLKDSAREEHCEIQTLSQKKQAVKDRGAGKEIKNDSLTVECCENQTLSQQKQAVNDKGTGINVDSTIHRIQRDCDRRMRKLIKKQQQEIQEFHQIWEVKISELEKDHKLELAIIRCLHNEDLARMADKLKLLDVKFAKKMEEFILLKAVELKNLEAHLLTARNVEREKEAGWLASAKSCCSSKEVGGLSQSSTQAVKPLTMHNVEDKGPSKSVQGNDVAMSVNSVSTDMHEIGVEMINKPKKVGSWETVCGLSASKEGVPGDIRPVEPKKAVPPEVPEAVSNDNDYAAPVQLSDNQTGLPCALLNQRDGNDEATTSGLLLVGQRLETEFVPNEIQPVELNKDAPPEAPETVANDIDYATPVELSEYSSNTGVDEGDGTGLPGALVNQRDEADETTTSGLPLVGQRLEPQVLHEIESVELNKEVPPEEPETVSNDIDHAALLELSDHSSDTGFDKGDQTGFSGALVNQRDETDETTTSGLPSVGQRLEPQIVPNEIHPVELNKVVPPGVPETVPDDIDYSNPVESSNNSSYTGFDKEGGTGLPCALLNQRDGTDETTTSGLPLVGQRMEPEIVLNEIEPVELSKEVPPEEPEAVANEIVGYANPMELSSNTFDKGIGEGDAIGRPDALVNHGDDIDETTTGGLPLVEKMLSKPQVLEDVTHQDLTSAVLQDQDAQVAEKQNTSPCEADAPSHIDNATPEESIVNLQDRIAPVLEDQVTLQIQVANSELIDSVIPVQDKDTQVVEQQNTSDSVDDVTTSLSNIQWQEQELVVEEQGSLQIEPENSEPVDSVSLVQTNDALPIENLDELHIGSSDESLLCNQPTSFEVECQSHLIEEVETVPQESSSQSGSNWELNLDIGSETIDFLHQDGLEPGSLGHLYGPSYLFPDPNQQPASFKSPPLYAATLHKEMDRIRIETEQLKKNHEDMAAQLRSDREKEIQEMLAQIDKKYELKLQDVEAEFSSKKNGLENNRKKVFQSKLLAEFLGSTCLGLWSFGLPELHQATASSSMQNQPLQSLPVASSPGQPAPGPLIAGPNLQAMQHQPLQHTTRPPHAATVSAQPVPGLPIPGPNLQAMQHQPLQHLMRPIVATYPAQPALGPPFHGPIYQAMQQLLRPYPSQNFAAPPIQIAQHATPPSFRPSSRPPVIGSVTPTGGNPHSGGGIRSIPPHLQLRGPSPASSRPSQHLPPPASQNTPQLQGVPPSLLNPLSLSALQLLMDVDDRAQIPLEQFCWAQQRLQNIQGNQITSPGVPTDTIYLSDED